MEETIILKRKAKMKILNNEIVIVPVESSNISTWSYNPITQVMTVLFKKGTIYKYYNVDKGTALRFTECESVGKQFRESIMDKFTYTRLKADGDTDYKVEVECL